MGIFATYSAEVYGILFVSEKMIRIARFWIASIQEFAGRLIFDVARKTGMEFFFKS